MICIERIFYSFVILVLLTIYCNGTNIRPADPHDTSVGNTPKIRSFFFYTLIIAVAIIIILIIIIIKTFG